MKWIKIEEKTPALMKTVLLSNGISITVGWNEHDDEDYYSFYSCENRDWPEDIKYWAELPEPPMKGLT